MLEIGARKMGLTPRRLRAETHFDPRARAGTRTHPDVCAGPPARSVHATHTYPLPCSSSRAHRPPVREARPLDPGPRPPPPWEGGRTGGPGREGGQTHLAPSTRPHHAHTSRDYLIPMACASVITEPLQTASEPRLTQNRPFPNAAPKYNRHTITNILLTLCQVFPQTQDRHRDVTNYPPTDPGAHMSTMTDRHAERLAAQHAANAVTALEGVLKHGRYPKSRPIRHAIIDALYVAAMCARHAGDGNACKDFMDRATALEGELSR